MTVQRMSKKCKNAQYIVHFYLLLLFQYKIDKEFISINLSDEIIKCAPEFKNLKGITIYDLITFGIHIKTNKRVDRHYQKKKRNNYYLILKMIKKNMFNI